MSINSRESLIEYAFKKLGAPVIEINVDWTQAEDRLDDALEYFQERHFDGVERHFYKHEVTSDDVTNGYINTNGLTAGSGAGYADAPAGSKILSVVNVFPFGSQTKNMFSVKYQMSLQDYFGVNRGFGSNDSMGLASYDSAKRFISMVSDMFNPAKNFRFNKV